MKTPEFFTAEEIASIFQVSKRTAYRQFAAFGGVRLGPRIVRYPRSRVEEIKRNGVDTPQVRG